MKDRDQLRLQKQQACDEKIRQLYMQMPKLAELDRRIAQQNLDMIRQGILRKNTAAQVALQRDIEAMMAERRNLLAEKGLDETIYEPEWDCPICKDRGYLDTGETCACFRQEQLENLFQQSGMSRAMRTRTFDNFDGSLYDDPVAMEEKIRTCKQMAADIGAGRPTESLFLTGDVGRGKTHLSGAIANAVVEQGNTVIYRRAADLFDLIRQMRFSEDVQTYRAAMHQLRTCDLLVIDDLGAERTTEFAIEQLVMLLEDRNDGNKPWIINSNLNMNDITALYGGRVADRILDSAIVFRLNRQDSMRLDRAKDRMARL